MSLAKRTVFLVLAILLLGVAGHAVAAHPESGSAPAASAKPEERAEPTESAGEAWEAEDEEEPGNGGAFAMFHDIHIPAGEVHHGDVVCLFGNAMIEGEVTHDVVVILGSLHLSGPARHNVVAVLSNVTIDEGAEVGHDLVNVLGSLDNRGKVHHEAVNIPLFAGPLHLAAPFGVIGNLIAWAALLWMILTFLLMLLIAAVAPDRVRVLSEEAPQSLLLAYLAGLGGYVALWVVNALLFITVIGIPLACLVYLAFIVLKWLGLAGIYHYVGRSFGRLTGRELSLLPAVLLGFLPFALLLLLPMFVGGIGFLIAIVFRILFWLLVEIPAVGLVILTRVGGRPRKAPGMAAPPVSVAATGSGMP